ncbi:MAG TPA: phosphoketolase family protein [Ktedonobacterales bacterium]|nr:phosphoketolase family protein [Ktedonobacterales bacterium]
MPTTIPATPAKETALPRQQLDQLDAQWRAANYLAAAQIYLRRNPLLREPLRPDDIKPRLLGHWGTVPGLTLVYTHLNRLIQQTDANVLLVVGPGHGAPAVLSEMFLDGSMEAFYPQLTRDLAGLSRLTREFSWPGGFPSHVGPTTPGTINEGGELGYSLAHSYGAALDNPDLIVACVVGDGEAETGPLAAAWQSNKFLDPASDGAVLPILHLNGYKLSGPTIYARMSDDELTRYFEGLGYQVGIVAEDDPAAAHVAMWRALDWACDEIHALQERARTGERIERPAWPMLLLRTPKGWTGPKTLDGKPVENTFHAHQIPIPDPAHNPTHLAALEQWMRSYHPERLFDEAGRPAPEVTAIMPTGDRRLGMNPHANSGVQSALKLPDYTEYAVPVASPGATDAEATRTLGVYLRDVFARNRDARNFRLVCPDETTSNRLDAVFEETERPFEWPLVPTDEYLSRNGRVMEILSEHTCEGWLEGYLLTGRHGVFACYEAFITIIDSMANQFGKWLKLTQEIPWRKPIASLNYLLTSHAWRQDHNGYSHQGPGFINTIMSKKSSVARIYLPPDANCLLSVADHCLRSRNYINLILIGKQPQPQWLDMRAAQEHCARGVGVWEWASNDAGAPDVVLAAAGDVPTMETLAAAWLLRRDMPDLRVRVVNVVDLLTLESHRDHPHGLDEQAFNAIFTEDAPVVFAFHGYARAIHELVYHRPNPQRFHVRGYNEEGTTTTPFDMVVANQISRYHLAMLALHHANRVRSRAGALIDAYQERLAAHQVYIREHDADLPEVRDWRWSQLPDDHADHARERNQYPTRPRKPRQ